ncbi:MAG: hypothetical protein JWP13_608 [Candidatus Saccharibacteria bacterium]|nr:hypothetical protein [Candidatus Saccharibacteria bacterium]
MHSLKSPAIAASSVNSQVNLQREYLGYSKPMATLTAPNPRRTYRFHDSDVVMTDGDFPYVIRVRDLAEDDKPREKLLKHGPKDLSIAELVATLLSVGTKKEEVMTMAHRILKEYGERALINETDPAALAEALDIPIVKACQLVASFELGRRFYENRGGKPVEVRTALQAYCHLQGMAFLQKEQLRALYLNSRYQVIHEETVSVGSLTANIVHPREVFQPAIEYGAVAVIVAHNHPSGSLEPTQADRDVTLQLGASGALLGIELLDHLIITGESYVSIIGGVHE